MRARLIERAGRACWLCGGELDRLDTVAMLESGRLCILALRLAR